MRASTFHIARNSLCRIPGDLRVSSGKAQLTPQTAMQCEAYAFAQFLMARYYGWQTHWPSLDLVLRQKPSGTSISYIYHQVQMQVAPRLNLTIRGEARIQHQRSVERAVRTLREPLVHYLSSRGTRIEAVATQDSLTPSRVKNVPSPGTGAELLLARPVSRVVRRPVTESAPDDRRRSTEAATTLPGQRPIAPGRTNPPAPTPVDVNRLTDQVIQAIDRRIVAQRERLGRT